MIERSKLTGATHAIRLPGRAAALETYCGYPIELLSEADSIAEGAERVNGHAERGALLGIGPCHREGFAQLWADTYGPESWGRSDWVWVYEFERVEAPNA